MPPADLQGSGSLRTVRDERPENADFPWTWKCRGCPMRVQWTREWCQTAWSKLNWDISA